MFCTGAKTYQVDNTIGAAVGEQVTIGVTPGSVSHSANLAYILPLTVAIAGAALGTSLGGNGGAILGAGCGLVVSFLYVRFRSRREAENLAGRPYIISRS
jgi:sigma-E factor negative regulatory protein RseC